MLRSTFTIGTATPYAMDLPSVASFFNTAGWEPADGWEPGDDYEYIDRRLSGAFPSQQQLTVPLRAEARPLESTANATDD